ncbi:TPA: hypothetical protein QB443_002152, partial [Pasteurella multocida]|nr:hypothetical protein [Pasteurella multocida]
MSNKINIFVIIKDHFCTLENYTNGRISKIDILTFWVIPALCVLGLATYQYEINKELVSLIVNFASIVTSLLISVLVLIYDQYSKAKSETDIQILKKKILEQLFST